MIEMPQIPCALCHCGAASCRWRNDSDSSLFYRANAWPTSKWLAMPFRAPTMVTHRSIGPIINNTGFANLYTRKLGPRHIAAERPNLIPALNSADITLPIKSSSSNERPTNSTNIFINGNFAITSAPCQPTPAEPNTATTSATATTAAFQRSVQITHIILIEAQASMRATGRTCRAQLHRCTDGARNRFTKRRPAHHRCLVNRSSSIFLLISTLNRAGNIL